MKDYNGFSGTERSKVDKLHREAMQTGALPKPCKCSICGQTKGKIHYHLEDYSKPFEDLKEICMGCHMRLHIRFDYPNLWKKFLWEIREGRRSPPYENPLQFFSAMRKEGINKDIEFVEPLPTPHTWAEALPLIEPNLNQ